MRSSYVAIIYSLQDIPQKYQFDERVTLSDYDLS